MTTEEPRVKNKAGYLQIPTKFNAYGYRYELVKRVKNVAIYKQTKKGINQEWFEVVLISKHDGYEIAGNRVEPSEVYPSAEQWGEVAFTCHSLARAEIRMKQLLK
jgi:hypothetical protein